MNARTALSWLIVDIRVATWDLLINRFAGSSLTPRVARYAIYRLCGIAVRTPSLSPGIYFQSDRVSIGHRSFVNRGVKFYSGESFIHIGQRVQIAMGVTFVAETHAIGGPDQRCDFRTTLSPITVGDGCWVGANATILAGVTIGPGCVIAAGAVVTRECEANGMYGGVPARRVKDL